VGPQHSRIWHTILGSTRGNDDGTNINGSGIEGGLSVAQSKFSGGMEVSSRETEARPPYAHVSIAGLSTMGTRISFIQYLD
jgi:hypothetical protein